ncbi:LYR motif-containing protein 5B [Triplophysa tibetana]|uniref:LYR motif-containing protein 5B n=1 Tax=Triplophysa tibetana TaxID=1572043 RepID=A0A5A9MWU8_9TELE|nr:LYR motif-containing protein 5B [Triplophysa tibetana]
MTAEVSVLTVFVASKGRNDTVALAVSWTGVPKRSRLFQRQATGAFAKNRDVKDPEKIKELISRGEFVVKELEALYYLRKHRALKKRYMI